MDYEPVYEKHKFKNGQTYELADVGKDGILIFKDLIFEAPFDEKGSNDYNSSTLKEEAEAWWNEYAPDELRDKYTISPPAIEEVFSQKMLNMCNNSKRLVSKRFPIFSNEDNRIKEFEWWTCSAYTYSGNTHCAWFVSTDGIGATSVCNSRAFVPILRRKK